MQFRVDELIKKWNKKIKKEKKNLLKSIIHSFHEMTFNEESLTLFQSASVRP